MGQKSRLWSLQFFRFSPHGCGIVALAPAITFVLRHEERTSHEESLYPATSNFISLARMWHMATLSCKGGWETYSFCWTCCLSLQNQGLLKKRGVCVCLSMGQTLNNLCITNLLLSHQMTSLKQRLNQVTPQFQLLSPHYQLASPATQYSTENPSRLASSGLSCPLFCLPRDICSVFLLRWAPGRSSWTFWLLSPWCFCTWCPCCWEGPSSLTSSHPAGLLPFSFLDSSQVFLL